MFTFDKKLKLYGQILAHAADGIVFISADRKVTFWNRGAQRITGYASEETVGRLCYEGCFVHEDEKGDSLCDTACPLSLFLAGQEEVRRNVLLKRKSGGKVLVEEHSMPLFSGADFTGAILSLRAVAPFKGLRALQLKTEKLERLIPICGWCKRVREDADRWESVEVFLSDQGFGEFTHSLCPSCSETIFSKKLYMESYQHICKAISRSLSLDEVLRLIVTNIVTVMNVKASLLRLLDKETGKLEVAAYHGLSESYVNKGPVDYDASIDDALAGKPVSVYDITADKSARYRKEADREGIRSILSIPLRAGDEVIGVLRMYTAEPVEYSKEDLNFVTAIAEQAAIAIMNARLFEHEVSREREYLNVFQEVTKAISSTLDVKEVLSLIVRKLPEVMKVKGATIRLLDDTGRELELVAACGLSEKYLNKGPVDSEENIRAALNERPVAIVDASTDDRIRYKKEAEEEGIKSMLTLPIVARGRVIGVLRLLTAVPRNFAQGEIDFAAALAEQCGTAIENARLYEKLHKEVSHLSAMMKK